MIQIISDEAEVKTYFFEMMQWAVANLPTKPDQVKPQPRIITGEELCKELDVTIQTLIRWRQKGKIPYLQIGSSIRYDFYKVLAAIEVTKKKGAIK
jgi:hypothetical protein